MNDLNILNDIIEKEISNFEDYRSDIESLNEAYHGIMDKEHNPKAFYFESITDASEQFLGYMYKRSKLINNDSDFNRMLKSFFKDSNMRVTLEQNLFHTLKASDQFKNSSDEQIKGQIEKILDGYAALGENDVMRVVGDGLKRATLPDIKSALKKAGINPASKEFKRFIQSLEYNINGNTLNETLKDFTKKIRNTLNLAEDRDVHKIDTKNISSITPSQIWILFKNAQEGHGVTLLYNCFRGANEAVQLGMKQAEQSFGDSTVLDPNKKNQILLARKMTIAYLAIWGVLEFIENASVISKEQQALKSLAVEGELLHVLNNEFTTYDVYNEGIVKFIDNQLLHVYKVTEFPQLIVDQNRFVSFIEKYFDNDRALTQLIQGINSTGLNIDFNKFQNAVNNGLDVAKFETSARIVTSILKNQKQISDIHKAMLIAQGMKKSAGTVAGETIMNVANKFKKDI